MKRLFIVLGFLVAFGGGAAVARAAGNTDHVDGAGSVLLVGQDGKAAVVSGAQGAFVTLSTLLAGEDQTLNRQWGGSKGTYLNIAAGTATTTVKSGAGMLHTICVNTKGASANVLTVYDNTSAASPLIATMDDTSAVGCQTYDVAFATGLTVKSTTGTGADLTVSYL